MADKYDLCSIKIRTKEHERVLETTALLQHEFRERAKAAGIQVISRKQHKNLPGQPEAAECLMNNIPISAYVGTLIEKAAATEKQRQRVQAGREEPTENLCGMGC